MNLETGVWSVLHPGDGLYDQESNGIPHITRCKGCMVMHKQRQDQEIPNLRQIPPINWKKAEDKIKIEGWYIFGGIQNKKASDKLYIFKFI